MPTAGAQRQQQVGLFLLSGACTDTSLCSWHWWLPQRSSSPRLTFPLTNFLLYADWMPEWLCLCFSTAFTEVEFSECLTICRLDHFFFPGGFPMPSHFIFSCACGLSVSDGAINLCQKISSVFLLQSPFSLIFLNIPSAFAVIISIFSSISELNVQLGQFSY